MYYNRIFVSGEFSDSNSSTADQKNSPQPQSQPQSQSQNNNDSQLPSNILDKNQIFNFNDGENLTQDPHELQNKGFDEYGFRDENGFENSHLNDRNSQNYSREDEEDNEDGDGDENENESVRISESYTKYSPQNIPSRRRGSQLHQHHQQQQQQQQQHHQIIVRSNFNKSDNQKTRPSPPQRLLSEITVRNTRISQNPLEYNSNSQRDYTEFEPALRRKNGKWGNREIATPRNSNSEYGTGYSQSIELKDRMRNNQNSNSNTNNNNNNNLNQNNRNLKDKNSK